MTGPETSNARPLILAGTGAGATKEERTMPGTANSGRRPAAAAPSDALSESLMDAMAELAQLALARKKHDQRQRMAEHRLAAMLRDAWNHHANTYQPHPGVAA